MRIFVNLKSVGKRKQALERQPYSLPDNAATLRELLTCTVREEVRRYNAKDSETMLLPFLTEAQIEEQSTVGKVGFGRIYSDKKMDEDKAVSIAIQGFEDGLFRVLVNDREATELDLPLEIKEDDTLTFIRLTFLAGRLW